MSIGWRPEISHNALLALLLVSVVTGISQMSHDGLNGPVTEQNDWVKIHHFS